MIHTIHGKGTVPVVVGLVNTKYCKWDCVG